MPDVMVPQPQQTADLGQMWGPQSAFPAAMGVQQFNQAQQTNQLNQQIGQQAYKQQSQMNPLLLQEQATKNQQGLAELFGKKTQNLLDLNKLQMDNATLQDRISQTKKDIVTKMSSDDLVQQLNQIKQNMADPKLSPEERQTWAQLYSHTSEMALEKQKLEMEKNMRESVANIQGQWQQRINEMNNQAGRYGYHLAKYNLTNQQQLDQLKTASQKVSKLRDIISGDAFNYMPLEERNAWIKKYNDQVPLANAEQAASRGQAQGNAPDIAGLTGGAVPTQPLTQYKPMPYLNSDAETPQVPGATMPSTPGPTPGPAPAVPPQQQRPANAPKKGQVYNWGGDQYEFTGDENNPKDWGNKDKYKKIEKKAQ